MTKMTGDKGDIPHVDPGQVGVCALDPMTDCPHQQPPAILLLPHQGAPTVTLQKEECDYWDQNLTKYHQSEI